jgi:hypothetical protein
VSGQFEDSISSPISSPKKRRNFPLTACVITTANKNNIAFVAAALETVDSIAKLLRFLSATDEKTVPLGQIKVVSNRFQLLISLATLWFSLSILVRKVIWCHNTANFREEFLE